MPELKIHDPSVVSIQRHPGKNGYWIVHKDGTEEFVKDKPMKNPRKLSDEDKEELGVLQRNFDINPDLLTPHGLRRLRELKKENPRKPYRELRKPERPGNYQKIMKEIDDKGATEYKFRMLPPGKFDEQSFRRKVIATGVSIVVGCPKGEFSHLFNRCKDGMAVQALRLAKSVFKTKESAAKWIASHVMEKYGKNPREVRFDGHRYKKEETFSSEKEANDYIENAEAYGEQVRKIKTSSGFEVWGRVGDYRID